MRSGAKDRRSGGFWAFFWSELGEAGRLSEAAEGERRDKERALVDALALRASRAGYGPAAIFLAEAAKPLGGLGANLLRLSAPALGPLLEPGRLENLACLLEDRENLERLAAKVEAFDETPARTEELRRGRSG